MKRTAWTPGPGQARFPALSGFRIHVETELPGAEGKKVNFADAKRSYANKTSFELARSLMMCAVR